MQYEQATLDLEVTTQRFTWDALEEIIKFMAPKIRDYFDKVLATTGLLPEELHLIPISRGGSIPAVMLSHLLNLPIRDTIHIQSYVGKKQGTFTTGALPILTLEQIRGALFVDDIIDTGVTVEFIREHFIGARFVAPYGKVSGIKKISKYPGVLPVKIPIIVADDIWIESPWERTSINS